jgi:hypothetical protein
MAMLNNQRVHTLVLCTRYKKYVRYVTSEIGISVTKHEIQPPKLDIQHNLPSGKLSHNYGKYGKIHHFIAG